jgi:hypothetical protein
MYAGVGRFYVQMMIKGEANVDAEEVRYRCGVRCVLNGYAFLQSVHVSSASSCLAQTNSNASGKA